MMTPPAPAAKSKKLTSKEIFEGSEVHPFSDILQITPVDSPVDGKVIMARFYVNKETRQVYVSRWGIANDGYPHYEVRDAIVELLGWNRHHIVGGKIVLQLQQGETGSTIKSIFFDGLASINADAENVKDVASRGPAECIADPKYYVTGVLGEALARSLEGADVYNAKIGIAFRWDPLKNPKNQDFTLSEMLDLGLSN